MRLLRYLSQYRIQDMKELIRNEKKSPVICNADLKGKTAVISGATSGIGFETARLFAEKGASLICLNRNPAKSEKLEKELREKFNCSVKSIITDFNRLDQVKQCAKELLSCKTPIDIIIHNTGVFNTKKLYSCDHIEMVFQVNHLGAFLLNFILKEKLKKENRARIIYVNSEGHRFALAGVHLNDLDWKKHLYTGLKSYGASKTAQLLTMQRFSEYFAGSSVTINAMHPGNVKSAMGVNNGKLYYIFKKKFILPSAREPDISAKALLFLAASKDVQNISGKFFNLTTLEKPAPHARDYTLTEKVWNKSLELCGLL